MDILLLSLIVLVPGLDGWRFARFPVSPFQRSLA